MSESPLYPAEAALLAQAYLAAAELLEEHGYQGVSLDPEVQAAYDAALAQACAFARQRHAQLSGAPWQPPRLPGVGRPAEAWEALDRELRGDGELLSGVNRLVPDSIGQWGLELLRAFVALRRAEFKG